jgi:hypothetical protein
VRRPFGGALAQRPIDAGAAGGDLPPAAWLVVPTIEWSAVKGSGTVSVCGHDSPSPVHADRVATLVPARWRAAELARACGSRPAISTFGAFFMSWTGITRPLPTGRRRGNPGPGAP